MISLSARGGLKKRTTIEPRTKSGGDVELRPCTSSLSPLWQRVRCLLVAQTVRSRLGVPVSRTEALLHGPDSPYLEANRRPHRPRTQALHQDTSKAPGLGGATAAKSFKGVI